MTLAYPKRLIEVDLPIKRISEHARREKDMRRGHVPLLYIWPATRPPAACRAVLCASLWPDPADPNCPPTFRVAAMQHIRAFARRVMKDQKLADTCSEISFGRWNTLSRDDVRIDTANPAHLNQLRYALLDFIADFANWDNSTIPIYLELARALTQAAHEALGGAQGARPMVLDPFAGGGAIPLEALRIGADAFASELNPVAVLYNKLILEYIPRHGMRLVDELKKWGNSIKEHAEMDLSEFYPRDPDGSTPIVYLWARTIRCEGPACGAEIPLLRSLWLAKKGRHVAVKLIPDKKKKRIEFDVVENIKPKDVGEGTVRRGSATCPVCGYTTPVARVRAQLRERYGGAADARLYCVVTTHSDEQGRNYRLPTKRDLEVVHKATEELERRKRRHHGPFSLTPDEYLPVMSGVFNAPIYGHNTWGSLFTPRQALAISTFVRLAREYVETTRWDEQSVAEAVACILGLAINRLADLNASLCVWQLSTPNTAHVFGRWALPMIMDFGEINPLAAAGGSPESVIRRMLAGISYLVESNLQHGTVEQASATNSPLPDDSVQAFVTDPPYYNAVPYADLSDFFYVWLKRTVGDRFPNLFSDELSPKEKEICEMAGWDPERYPNKDKAFFEGEMRKAMAEGRRVLTPEGIGVVVFAHKSTSGWEAQLQAMIDAGWTVTGSWPIDTEMVSRLRAKNSATLTSSIHLVCRPRENSDGSRRHDAIGDWRDVLAELPKRIQEWMPRLAQEGVVGADAIFACLGPALEIFSRYERVEKADGTAISLREYLEYVWAAVGREALNQIFTGADPTGFEEDARLTALWLWTLGASADGKTNAEETGENGEESEEVETPRGKAVQGGFVLEYDTARKLAQGIGAHLEDLNRPGSVVEIKGDKARLLSVSERRKLLLGSASTRAEAEPKKKKRGGKQMTFVEIEQTVGSLTPAEDMPEGEFTTGETTLDRIHQAMLLFGEGRSEALKRFLVEEGAGRDQRFWRLAQTLSALYPTASQEKRWVDGVLARKKGLGL